MPSGYVTSGLPYRPEKSGAGSEKSVGRLGKSAKVRRKVYLRRKDNYRKA